MKYTTMALTAALAVTATAHDDPTWEQDLMITAGVIYGLTGQDTTQDLRECLTDWPVAARELVHAFKLFESLDARDAIAGGRLLSRAITDMKEGVKDCKNSGDDWEALGLWFENFIHPVHLVERIAMNTVHNAGYITKEVLKGRSEWKNEEYFKFGVTIGEVAVLETMPLHEDAEALLDLKYLQ